jgi:hypothetical protein
VTNMSDKPLALAHIVNPVKVGTQSDATRRRGLALRLKSLLNHWASLVEPGTFSTMGGDTNSLAMSSEENGNRIHSLREYISV